MLTFRVEHLIDQNDLAVRNRIGEEPLDRRHLGRADVPERRGGVPVGAGQRHLVEVHQDELLDSGPGEEVGGVAEAGVRTNGMMCSDAVDRCTYLPTPPKPTTTTVEFLIFFIPSSPKNSTLRDNCSSLNSSLSLGMAFVGGSGALIGLKSVPKAVPEAKKYLKRSMFEHQNLGKGILKIIIVQVCF